MARRFEARPRDTPRILCVGSITRDHLYTLGAPLVPGAKHRATAHADVGGGVAANAAVAIARLGGRATLVGVVGDDDLGDEVVDELRGERVDVDGIVRVRGAATPESVVITEPGGARTVVTKIPIETTDVEVPSFGSDHFSGVLVDARWDTASRRALEMAHRAGLPGVVDVDRLPADVGVLDHASHLVFSETALIERAGTTDLARALELVSKSTGAHVSVTTGSRGVTWIDGDSVVHLDAFDVDAVDTTGAGDVFHGAFALALAEGKAESDAFRFASATAALKCTRHGARAGTPGRAEVDEFLHARRGDERSRRTEPGQRSKPSGQSTSYALR